MTTKKTPVKTVKKVLPKIGEIGFKFKIDAEIIDIEEDWDEDEQGNLIKGYEVYAELGETEMSYTFTMEYLKNEIAKYDPKAKKAAQLVKIKEAEAKVIQLKKELEEM